MNSIEGIKIIRKGSYKDYLANGIFGGLTIGVLFFLVSIAKENLSTSLVQGSLAFLFILIIFIPFGFLLEEYYLRKKKLKVLLSGKFSFLRENNFNIHEDLFFQGVYKGYFVRVFQLSQRELKKKSIDYVYIQTFCDFAGTEPQESSKNINGQYYCGIISYGVGCLGLLPADCLSPDIDFDINAIIDVSKREGLNPLSATEWEEKYGREIKRREEEAVKRNTRQIIKIGKLDIKVIKKPKPPKGAS